VQVFEFSTTAGRLRLVNAPGSGDPRRSVSYEAAIASELMETALLVFNAGGHLAGQTELALFQKLRQQNVKVLPVLNKIDLCRSGEEIALLKRELADRLGIKEEQVFATAARPHPQLQIQPQGLTPLWKAVRASLAPDKQSALLKSQLIEDA
jgi:translation elongation factor EF-4